MIVTIDFESYYARDFSLSKMRIEEYIRDPRFEVIGVAIKCGDEPSVWTAAAHPHYDCAHDPIQAALDAADIPNNTLLCQNTRFDASILSWHYGITPRLYMDTMLMGRALILPFTRSVSLKNMAEYYSIGTKGTEVIKALDKHLVDFDATELDAYGSYCRNDAALTYNIGLLQRPQMPDKELALIDRTLRMYIEPRLHLNKAILEEHLQDVKDKKDETFLKLAAIGYEPSDMRSAIRFSAALAEFGVQCPTKISPTTHKVAPALAKTDPGFKELMNHDNPCVQVLCAARLDAKSTIEETRTQRLIDAANMSGKLTVPLVYYGAHTGRHSGDDRINLQNPPKKSLIRKAIQAPPGQKIMAADQAQIEARMLAVVAGQWNLVDVFASGEDVYCSFASQVYGRQVSPELAEDKNNPEYLERFTGKVGILSLGYSAAWRKFQIMLRNYGMSEEDSPDAFCEGVVTQYRRSYPFIVQFWKNCEYYIQCMISGTQVKTSYFSVEKNAIALPNGMKLRYHNIRRSMTGMGGYEYEYQGKTKYIYGGKLAENIIQALARIVVLDQCLTISFRYPWVLAVHDEGVFLVSDDDSACRQAEEYIEKEMTNPVSWIPHLPLKVKVKTGDNYLECK